MVKRTDNQKNMNLQIEYLLSLDSIKFGDELYLKKDTKGRYSGQQKNRRIKY